MLLFFFSFRARPRHRLFQECAVCNKFLRFFFIHNKIDWRNRKTQRISMNETWICSQQFIHLRHHSASVYRAKLNSFSHCCLSKKIQVEKNVWTGVAIRCGWVLSCIRAAPPLHEMIIILSVCRFTSMSMCVLVCKCGNNNNRRIRI